MHRTFALFLLLFGTTSLAFSQPLSNLRTKIIPVAGDTLVLDTLSLVPGSIVIQTTNAETLRDSLYSVDWVNATVVVKKNRILPDTLVVRYRVLTLNLGQEVSHKDPLLLRAKGEAPPDPFLYRPTPSVNLFSDQGLQTNGSLSRGISFGNNQDVFVNSSLNLQLSGKLNNDVEILAAITDENIPVQPEGNTQQLQEFDKVFIQLSKEDTRLIAGDFELRRPDSYFMNFFKRGQGASASTSFSLMDTTALHKTRRMNTAASVAIAKGRFNRLTFQGVEGNQGPYRLTGNNGEPYIIVLSGTEKVYIDGIRMVRGMQNDYIIDYNTAEVTFMPKRMITKDSRIIVEFEYSDRNYVRSFYFLNNEFVTDRVKLKFNFYSEQDSKNQPLLQELDSTRKAVMASVGDSIQNAYVPTADSLNQFDGTQVLYIKADSTTVNGTYPGIFIYSTDPAAARWQVTFTEVGTGKGDYVQDVSTANGRVFKWVEPIAGVSQGNYGPVLLLVTPKQKRMLTLGTELKIDPRKSLSFESSWSDNDINLFSPVAKAGDHGEAMHLTYRQTDYLSTDTVTGWQLKTTADYEFTSKNFQPLEPYRPAEFVRDWNTGGLTTNHNENILSAQAAASRRKNGTLGYQLKTYQRGTQYTGWNHLVFTDLKLAGFSLKGNASRLGTESQLNRTTFLRHYFDLSRTWKKLTLGIKDNAEDNRFRLPDADSLLSTSYSFQEWIGYAGYRDSSKIQGTFSVKSRKDWGAKAGILQPATLAHEAALTTEWGKSATNQFRSTTTYRELQVEDSSLTTTAPLKTLVNRIDHQLTLWKGWVSATTYYEVGSGRERKQEFYYLEVPAGQGTYAYIGDLNNNNVKDLNEFALSNFPDQARYIRVFYTTDEYIAIRSNSFSEVLNLQPVSRSSRKLFIQRFSDQFLIRMDKKTTGEEVLSSLNPFRLALADSQLVSTNSNLRNTIYFNRSDPTFGADYAWQLNKNKTLLVSGFDFRRLESHALSLRWNLTRTYQFTIRGEKQDLLNSSQFFDDRNYHLRSTFVEPKLTYQPSNTLRISSSYLRSEKQNVEGAGERVVENRISLESKFNSLNSGTMTARFNYIRLDYTGELNSFIAYELLGGLNPGTNFTWNLSMLRNLSKIIQVNLTYEGRKSEGVKTIHTGNVQFRALF